MRKLLRAVGWILGVLVAAWLGVCAWLSYTLARTPTGGADVFTALAPR